jgi:hypothetical protein
MSGFFSSSVAGQTRYRLENDPFYGTKASEVESCSGKEEARGEESVDDLVDRVFLDVFCVREDDDLGDQTDGEHLHPEDNQESPQ